jgi:hypothetical protein
MKALKKGTAKPRTGEQQIKGLIAKYEPKYQRLIRSVRKALRMRFPTADELIYDYNHAFVIGYSPTERGSDAVVALSAAANGLRLVFNQGPLLPDPKKLLRGSGKETRFIWVESAKTLALPEIEALMQATIDRARIPLRPSGRGKLIIKPSSAKQRSRPEQRH